MKKTRWTIAEAKAKFSEVVARANEGEPQLIVRRGRPAAVVVSAEEWERKSRRAGNLAEFLASSPLRGSGLELQRIQDMPEAPEL